MSAIPSTKHHRHDEPFRKEEENQQLLHDLRSRANQMKEVFEQYRDQSEGPRGKKGAALCVDCLPSHPKGTVGAMLRTAKQRNLLTDEEFETLTKLCREVIAKGMQWYLADDHDRIVAPSGKFQRNEIPTSGRSLSRYPAYDESEPFCFQDDEIVDISNYTETKRLSHSKHLYLSSHNKWVLQQATNRGCAITAAIMLVLDRNPNILFDSPNKTAILSYFRTSDLDKVEEINQYIEGMMKFPTIYQYIERHPYSSQDSINDEMLLKTLQTAIREHGSMLLTINDPIVSGHVIVVDDISETGVRLRDPAHGWEITVTLDAFKKRFPPFYVRYIQLR